jgi:hypothetical protein
MNEQRYKTLKAGDERREGDEARISKLEHAATGVLAWTSKERRRYGANPVSHYDDPGEWEPVQLLGHPILASDLMAAEFRRPLL